MKKISKILIITMLASLLTACAFTTNYKEPAGDNTAKLHFVLTKEISSLTFYKVDKKPHVTTDAYIYHAGTPIADQDTYRIEAGKTFAFTAIFHPRYEEYCEFNLSFVPKKNKLYHLILSSEQHSSLLWNVKMPGLSTCYLGLAEKNNGKYISVDMKDINGNVPVW